MSHIVTVLGLQARSRRNALQAVRAMQTRRAEAEEAQRFLAAAEPSRSRRERTSRSG